MRSVRVRRRILVAGLMAGAAGCTPFRDAPPPVDVRAVETPLGETVAPDDPYYQAAVRAISLRDYARALDYLQAARQKQPDDVRVLNAFGVVYDKLGRFDLSARYYSDAKKLDPASPIVAANQAYSAVLQAREYGTVVPFEVANSAQSPPARDSQMGPANPSSPAASEQVTGAPAVLPGLPDSMQPAGPPPAVVSLPAAAVADARSSNLNMIPAPVAVVPLAGIGAPPGPAAVGAPLTLAETGPSITIPDAITRSPAAVIVEPATRAANAVEPPAFPVVVSSAPIAIALPPIAATAVPANTPSVIPQVPSRVAVNSAPPGVAEPRTQLPIGTPSVPSAAFASAAPEQLASPLAPASPSMMPFAPEKSADPNSATSAAARAPAPDIVPAPPRASTAPKFASALPPARRSDVFPVPAKKIASDSVESAAVKAPAPKASPRPATEAIAALPARTKHTKSAASNSPVSRIVSAVHPAPTPRAGSRVQVASAVIHASGRTQAGTKSVAAQTVSPTKKLVLIGKPLFIINGSGRSGVSEPVRRRLASLRWTAPSWAVSDGAQQSVTTIRYAPIYFIVAHALARTLPFPSRLVACDKQCGGVSLILGRDLLKARFVKTAAVTTKRS